MRIACFVQLIVILFGKRVYLPSKSWTCIELAASLVVLTAPVNTATHIKPPTDPVALFAWLKNRHLFGYKNRKSTAHFTTDRNH